MCEIFKRKIGGVYKHLLWEESRLVSIRWIFRPSFLLYFQRVFKLRLRAKMKMIVKESGKDPRQTFKASNKWIQGFMKRKGLSVQKKTGKKHRPTEELLPRVKNFHWYSIYQMAAEEPWKRNLVETQQVFVNTTNISIFFYAFLKTENPKVPPTRPPSVLFQILRNLGGVF